MKPETSGAGRRIGEKTGAFEDAPQIAPRRAGEAKGLAFAPGEGLRGDDQLNAAQIDKRIVIDDQRKTTRPGQIAKQVVLEVGNITNRNIVAKTKLRFDGLSLRHFILLQCQREYSGARVNITLILYIMNRIVSHLPYTSQINHLT
ncbi:hypothetical protein M2322_003561 [Rhodoblastus acidophilus]|uniref:hypothetical protein n=1 Tax=Rhodoblastus acidophilus TaxID=1074 RepID=UPI00222497A7|nr:hypothetical protein [Rhodoblastus acidophilus]MCW2317996.1 hypothetical protein [Rhodoblastus acidophilus]